MHAGYRPVKLRSVVVAGLLLLAVVACKRAEQPAAPATRAAAPEVPHDGGTLLRRLENDVATFNYLLQTTDYERNVLSYLYDPLIDLDRDLKPIPGTAASWSVSPDGRTYTLKLDPRATFSDGKPVRASDVVFTIRRVMSEESMQFSGFFAGIQLDKLRAVDERTVEVTFDEPYVARWFAFNIGVLPEHVYGTGDFKTAFNDKVVGNGPYVLAGRQPGQSITLERRADYWREKPHIQRIVFKVIGDPGVAWNAMKRGDIDEMRVPTDLWAREKNARNIDFHDVWLLQYNCIAWNVRDPILADRSVRHALARAFDTKTIIATLYHGQARAVSGPFTPDQWAYDPKVQPVAFDLAGADALLSQAGWRDTNGDGIRDRAGKKLSIALLVPAGNKIGVDQGQIFQDSLKKIGVELTVQQLEGATFFQHVMRGNYQAAFFAWSLDPEPDLYALFHSSQAPPAGMNVIGYSNPEVDKAIEAARRESDPARRPAAWQRAHALLAADQPYLWTLQLAQKWAVNERVKGEETSKGFGFFLWQPGARAWWVSG